MKEHAVGSFVINGREVYKVVNNIQRDCAECDLGCGTLRCWSVLCGSTVGKDNSAVMFTLFDTIPEDEEPYDLESL